MTSEFNPGTTPMPAGIGKSGFVRDVIADIAAQAECAGAHAGRADRSPDRSAPNAETGASARPSQEAEAAAGHDNPLILPLDLVWKAAGFGPGTTAGNVVYLDWHRLSGRTPQLFPMHFVCDRGEDVPSRALLEALGSYAATSRTDTKESDHGTPPPEV